MSLEEARELLPLYALGALSPEERARVEEALRRYPELWPEAKALLEAAASLAQDLPPEPVPPGLEERVLRRVRRPRAWPLLLRAAAVLAFLALGYGAYFGLSWTLALREASTQVLGLVSPEGAPAGRAVILGDGRALVVLKAPRPSGRVYQAWGLGEGAPIPLSTFRLPLKTLRLPPEARALAVSLEPPGGSPSPTEIIGLPKP
ncbi:anti-sigma factor [Thermus sediminis]|uniref:anti-sigma factor n=1 Tax=Thermus sediminis TaxID=1761908 RepID=UPI000E3E235C|nr:anti-sigma factor [Thermus sediminis]